MGRRRDAALTLLVAGPVCVAVVLLRPPLRPAPVLVGGVGALLAEAAATLARCRVRAAWERRGVRGLAVVAALAATAVGVRLVGPTVLLAVLCGLLTYLFVLAAVEGRERATRRRGNS